MPSNVPEQREIMKDQIVKALQEFTSKTGLKVEEIKITIKEIRTDFGSDYFYNELVFKTTI